MEMSINYIGIKYNFHIKLLFQAAVSRAVYTLSVININIYTHISGWATPSTATRGQPSQWRRPPRTTTAQGPRGGERLKQILSKVNRVYYIEICISRTWSVQYEIYSFH